jgi:hypothetical protein
MPRKSKAFEKIAEGLNEALSIARGTSKPPKPRKTNARRKGPIVRARNGQREPALPSSDHNAESEGLSSYAKKGQLVFAPTLGDLIEDIRALHRREVYALKQRGRQMNSLGAFVRGQLGWTRDMPEAESKLIKARATAIVKDPTGTEFEDFVTATTTAAAPFDAMYKTAVKQMEKLAEQLPVWAAFGKDIRGFGVLSLARIIAETGDLSNYPDKSKVWARLGMGVTTEGKRQCNRPGRRAVVWNVGDPIIKGNGAGPYRAYYLERKAYEHARDPEMSKMHAHRRAQRAMEKRLLKHLWQAWRRTIQILPETAIAEVSAADLSRAA